MRLVPTGNQQVREHLAHQIIVINDQDGYRLRMDGFWWRVRRFLAIHPMYLYFRQLLGFPGNLIGYGKGKSNLVSHYILDQIR